MPDTLPPILSVWSGLAAPLCCLANKSQARLCSESLQSALEANLSGPGSTIYQTVWKPHTTPLGRQIYRLRASARRTSDSEPSLGPSGWPTPITQDAKHSGMARSGPGQAMKLVYEAQLSGWPTPNAVNGDRTAYKDFDKLMARKAAGRQTNLQEIVMVAGWPTPSALERKMGPETAKKRMKFRKENANQSSVPMYLNEVAQGVEDTEIWTALGHQTTQDQAARITADGMMLTGCSAGMESGGQLNPAFSGWLMGFPEAWCKAAISCQLPNRLRKAPKKPGA